MPLTTGSTKWQEIAVLMKAAILAAKPNYKVEIVESGNSYISGSVAQTTLNDITILISPPEGGAESREALISYVFRKYYYFDIQIVVKADAALRDRMVGKKTDGIYDIRDAIETVLDHNNFGNAVDNKAGTNFEQAWAPIPSDNKAITIYQTVYLVTKTEIS